MSGINLTLGRKANVCFPKGQTLNHNVKKISDASAMLQSPPGPLSTHNPFVYQTYKSIQRLVKPDMSMNYYDFFLYKISNYFSVRLLLKPTGITVTFMLFPSILVLIQKILNS